MEVNLKEKITSIYGLNNSGKSFFTKNVILPNYRCLVIDPLVEYPFDLADVYIPDNKQYPNTAKENERLIKNYIYDNYEKYDLIVYEECSRFFPNKQPFFPEMRSFFDTYRHYNKMGLIFISRRPSQVNTEISSLSHYIFCFGNKGKADITRFNSESAGLGDAVSQLSGHEFILVNEDRTFTKHDPIEV